MAKGKAQENHKLFVVKANDLIRKTRYSLTTQQQKILLYAISKIKRDDPPETEYEINLEELCEACGIEIDQSGGYYYIAIKQDLLKLVNSNMWVKMPDNSEVTVSWLSEAAIIPLCGTVYVRFHRRLAPYLFELKEQYTQYRLENVLVFKGKYTIRLYELLRSYTTQKAIDAGQEKEVMFSVDNLRNLLMCPNYPRWVDFDRFVLREAVKEINESNEEMCITYDTYRTGRTITKVNFIIGTARVKQMLQARLKKRQRLEGDKWNIPGEQMKMDISAGYGADKPKKRGRPKKQPQASDL